MQSVSTDKALRDAATQATKELSDFGIESSMRQDIYIALKQTSENTKSGSLDAESDRLLERMLRDKRRAGLSLSAEKQAKFKELKTQINNKCIEFRKNCDEEAGFLLLTEGELEGVPDSVLSGYEKVEDGGESKCKVTHKTPDIVPVMRYCKNPSTRRRAFLSFENRSSINTKLFQEVMEVSISANLCTKYRKLTMGALAATRGCLRHRILNMGRLHHRAEDGQICKDSHRFLRRSLQQDQTNRRIGT